MDACNPQSFTITTGSRLHFGLLDTAPPFGGVGMMIDRPATQVRFESAAELCVEGPAANRVWDVVERFACCRPGGKSPACLIRVLARPAAHTGLGTGTQLALAVAEGLIRWTATQIGPDDLAAQVAGRGQRSAVGIHGYWHGGLIHEAPGGDSRPVNRIVHRVEIPERWRVVLFGCSGQAPRVAGEEEQRHFSALPPADPAARDALRSIVDRRLIPAARVGDFHKFAAAVYDYNRSSGELFAAVQGGAYNGAVIERAVGALRTAGIIGVGQSSWGPTVFAFADSQEQADRVATLVPAGWACAGIVRAANSPRRIE